MSGKTLVKGLLPFMLVAAVLLSACGTAKAAPSSSAATGGSAGVSSTDGTRYKPTWVTPALSGNQLSVSLSAVEQGKMVHFWVTLPSGKEAFMAYVLDGVTYMRADICVPCRSSSFSLQKGILVCDTCGTTFNAKTGKGISGACVNYPKAEVKWQLQNGNLVTTLADLDSAYQSTLQAG
jgi:nitrite reductase/ring-hydroxylating ferredoxin subunit